MSLDLRDALRVKAELGHKDLRIGVVVKDIPGMCSLHTKGKVVLFKKESGGTICVETPMNDEWIEKTKARGSGIRTVGTMVNVPRDFVEEVLTGDEEPYHNDFAQYGFDDSVPLLHRADNIRNALVRTMWAFNPQCPQPMSQKEKWAAVLAGGVIDELLALIPNATK